MSAHEHENRSGANGRLLRVLHTTGWLTWRLVKRTARSATYVLDFDGELEDFDIV